MLPENHLAWFLAETVDALDLDPFLERYRVCGKGEQAYPPRVRLRILLYAYSTGVFSSRKIAAKLETDVASRGLGAGLFPDFRTICNFRTRHRDDFAKVFVQIAQEAGIGGRSGPLRRQRSGHSPRPWQTRFRWIDGVAGVGGMALEGVADSAAALGGGASAWPGGVGGTVRR